VVIAVDALQMPASFSGVGRQALSIGAELHALPEELELEVRCPADVRPTLEPVFPKRTRFWTPIARSRPRARRIAVQQAVAPFRDSRETLLVCLGEQAPLAGRARILLVVNDVRRLVRPGTSGRAESAYYRLLIPRAVRRATTVVTISEFSRGQIRDVLGGDLDIRVVADHPRPKLAHPVGGKTDGGFLVVGALRPYKGIETAIDALARLPGELRRPLLLAGTEEGRGDELRRRGAERGVGEAVRFLGWKNDDELRGLYADCLATVNPSTYEGYGLPVAESLAYGAPTIASGIPPHREVAAEAALYFPAGDPEALAAAMRTVVEDPGRRADLQERALARSNELAAQGPRWAELILQSLPSA
jgi:glycosyltransferase involved in cell wall biosynthesis